jgi:asparagine synthase (glutamine-hydrolysing)
MCGIVGLISKEAKTKIYACNESIVHRGPDDEGYFFSGDLALAHRRLSIQDLSANGHQPMSCINDNYIIIFNGEIYNHWEIRKKLESKYTFKSNSDTETLLYGFIEYGKDILNQLNGIFSFALFDKQKEELFIARDQFGVKPLYYYCDDTQFWFSSEMKSILKTNFDRTISNESLVNYLTFLYSPGEKTPFEKVFKLLPGHFISLNISNFQDYKIEKYYDIPFDNSCYDKTEKELIDDLEILLTNAVNRQMLSDVPIGFFLSGGLDSSCILAIAKKLHPAKEFNCYTIKTNEGTNSKDGFVSDLYYARKVAKFLDVNLIEVSGEIDFVNEFDEMIYQLDEPQADSAPINIFNICKQARKDGIFVLLGGTAGDDLFSGYRRHQALKLELLIEYIPLFIRKITRNSASLLSNKFSLFRRIKKITKNLNLSKQDRILSYFSWIDDEDLKVLFSKKVKTTIEKYHPLDILKESLKNIPEEKNTLNQILYLEMKYFLADHNLNYTDKMSMASGVEVRVPFLDKELLEFSTKIPIKFKLKGITTKYILKKVMEKYLPKDVIYRSKSGFGTPIRDLVKKDMDNIISEYLSLEIIEKRKFFDSDSIEKLIINNKSGKIDASYTILSLLAIESWMRQFVD